MQIRELYIKNFGKFSDRHFYLSERMQVFYGENEYGKSTIYAFIKAMLFGMERGRGRAAGKDAFSRYEPWENPNYYAGAMRFTCGDRNFYLERSFDRYTKHAVLICEDDGETLSVEDGDLDMLLGGISLSSFENTAAIGQLTARPGQDLAQELKNYAANYYETGGSEVDLKQTFFYLKERRREVMSRLSELQDEKRKTCGLVEAQIDYLEKEENALKSELRQKQEALKKQEAYSLENESDGDEKENKETEKYTEDISDGGKRERLNRKKGFICLGIGLFLAGCGIAFRRYMQPVSMWLTVGGILLLGIGMVLAVCGGIIKQKRKDTSQEAAAKIRWECDRIKAELCDKQIQKRNLEEQLEEAAEKSEAVIRLEQTKAALELAEERIRVTASKMTEEFGGELNRAASRILAEITQGRYTRLSIGEALELYVVKEGRKIPAEYLSRGTLEQIYFALRMAALDMLYDEEIPVIFDEAFAVYDEKRLKSVLKWLREQPRQVIIFSCQRREKEMLSEEMNGFGEKDVFS